MTWNSERQLTVMASDPSPPTKLFKRHWHGHLQAVQLGHHLGHIGLQLLARQAGNSSKPTGQKSSSAQQSMRTVLAYHWAGGSLATFSLAVHDRPIWRHAAASLLCVPAAGPDGPGCKQYVQDACTTNTHKCSLACNHAQCLADAPCGDQQLQGRLQMSADQLDGDPTVTHLDHLQHAAEPT